jgi:hypothetical protein
MAEIAQKSQEIPFLRRFPGSKKKRHEGDDGL